MSMVEIKPDDGKGPETRAELAAAHLENLRTAGLTEYADWLGAEGFDPKFYVHGGQLEPMGPPQGKRYVKYQPGVRTDAIIYESASPGILQYYSWHAEANKPTTGIRYVMPSSDLAIAKAFKTRGYWFRRNARGCHPQYIDPVDRGGVELEPGDDPAERDWTDVGDESKFFAGRLREDLLRSFAFVTKLKNPLGDDSQWTISQFLNLSPAQVEAYLQTALDVEEVSPIGDPFRDVLERLPEWDGVQRLERALESCIAISSETPIEVARFASKQMILSTVARALDPGCAVHQYVLLQGAQGIGKSVYLDMQLPGERDDASQSLFYVALESMKISTKKLVESTVKYAFVEFPELKGVKYADRNAIKQMMTVSADEHRMPYAKRSGSYPRRWSFAGTSNESEPLPYDPEGSHRRWVPVKLVETHKMPGRGEAWVRMRGYWTANRNQVWAEAVWRYNAGERPLSDNSASKRILFPGEDHPREPNPYDLSDTILKASGDASERWSGQVPVWDVVAAVEPDGLNSRFTLDELAVMADIWVPPETGDRQPQFLLQERLKECLNLLGLEAPKQRRRGSHLSMTRGLPKHIQDRIRRTRRTDDTGSKGLDSWLRDRITCYEVTSEARIRAKAALDSRSEPDDSERQHDTDKAMLDDGLVDGPPPQLAGFTDPDPAVRAEWQANATDEQLLQAWQAEEDAQ